MAQIRGVEELRRSVPGFELWHLRRVEEFHLFRPDLPEDDDLRFSLVLVMSTETTSTLRVQIACSGVSNLRVTSFGGKVWQITGFDIVSVGDRGWEDMRWEVLDFENGALRFYCRDVEVKVLADP